MGLHVLADRLRNRKSKAGREKRLTTPTVGQFRLNVEGLEPRLLLYAVSGAAWPHPELVSVSFMPDATDVAGLPSALFGTMNAKWPTATWQKEMLRGLQSYAANANVNFSVASDDGSPFGSAGTHILDNNLQGDQDFGDIRIGAVSLGIPLGGSLLPPPINVDTTAGDFQLNSTSAWNIGASFDLFTVSAHEEGHSVGLCHSADSTAVMYDTYNGVKSALTSDDLAGIQAIYGTRPQDSFDAGSPNNTKATATVITSYINGYKQVTLTNLDVTTNSDADWYKITAPSGSSGTMTVNVQSTGLSLLAPKLSIYNNNGSLLGTVSGGYNSTISLSKATSSGQVREIKVEGAETGVFDTGAYALQVNFSSSSLPAVPLPNTATPSSGLPQAGCNASQQDHDHGESADSGSEGAPASSVVVVAGTDEGAPATNVRHDGKPSIDMDSFRTNFAFDRTPLGRTGLVAGHATQVAFHSKASTPSDAAMFDHLLDNGLADAVLPLVHFHSRVS